MAISRLVPRKGFDVAIEAAALLAPSRPDLLLAISGGGRDEFRLRRLAAARRRAGALPRRVANDRLPALYGCADVFTMPCRNRWGGLEQEGFGIVFVEAAACGVPQVAGDSGGAAEAVDDGVTGLVVRRPDDAREVAAAIEALLDDDALRADMAVASRKRAVAEFSYDVLAERLGRSLGVVSGEEADVAAAGGEARRRTEPVVAPARRPMRSTTMRPATSSSGPTWPARPCSG